jgi:nitrogen regulatory protein P-II 1
VKLITAIIKPFKLDDVQEALRDLDVQGLTVSEVSGHGRQGGQTEMWRGVEYRADLIPKVCVEVVVADELADDVVEALMAGATTGKIGDGKVWLAEVERVVRLRTGEEGQDALR